MKRIALLLVSAGLVYRAAAGYLPRDASDEAMPTEAESIEAIIEAMQKIKGSGFPERVHASVGHPRVVADHFIIWNNPYSGLAAVQVYTYSRDGKKWKLRNRSQFSGSDTIAIEIDTWKDRFVYKDREGKVLLALPFVQKERS